MHYLQASYLLVTWFCSSIEGSLILVSRDIFTRVCVLHHNVTGANLHNCDETTVAFCEVTVWAICSQCLVFRTPEGLCALRNVYVRETKRCKQIRKVVSSTLGLSNLHLLLVCGRLLDILAARKNPRGLSGCVLVDGQKQPSNFKLLSGYVVQVGAPGGSLLLSVPCNPGIRIITDFHHNIKIYPTEKSFNTAAESNTGAINRPHPVLVETCNWTTFMYRFILLYSKVNHSYENVPNETTDPECSREVLGYEQQRESKSEPYRAQWSSDVFSF